MTLEQIKKPFEWFLVGEEIAVIDPTAPPPFFDYKRGDHLQKTCMPLVILLYVYSSYAFNLYIYYNFYFPSCTFGSRPSYAALDSQSAQANGRQ